VIINRQVLVKSSRRRNAPIGTHTPDWSSPFMADPATDLDPVRLFVTWDASSAEDDAWSVQFVDGLRGAIGTMVDGRLPEEDRPQVIVLGDYSTVPAPAEMGALSVLLVVAPDPATMKQFPAPARSRLEAVMAANADRGTLEGRVITIGRAPGRLPAPAPVDGIVGIKVEEPTSDALRKVARTALVHASIALAERQGQFFISYSQRDGKAVAIAVEKYLRERGYKVWRDDSADRDGLSNITPGSDAQRTIEQAILAHGFVVLIDTPVAATRPWVIEEVRLAFGHLLPILPVVVEGGPDDRFSDHGKPDPGGRFESLASLGREVRLGRECLGNDAHPTADEAVRQKVAEIEDQFSQILLSHLRSRRRLVHHARRQFADLKFNWSGHRAGRLLFEAARDDPPPDPEQPPFRRLLLVGCSPYRKLVQEAIDTLCNCHDGTDPFDKFPKQSYQAAILVHNAQVAVGSQRRLIGGRRYLRLLRPYEIVPERIF
jgi:hypothetical protein